MRSAGAAALLDKLEQTLEDTAVENGKRISEQLDSMPWHKSASSAARQRYTASFAKSVPKRKHEEAGPPDKFDKRAA